MLMVTITVGDDRHPAQEKRLFNKYDESQILTRVLKTRYGICVYKSKSSTPLNSPHHLFCVVVKKHAPFDGHSSGVRGRQHPS